MPTPPHPPPSCTATQYMEVVQAVMGRRGSVLLGILQYVNLWLAGGWCCLWARWWRQLAWRPVRSTCPRHMHCDAAVQLPPTSQPPAAISYNIVGGLVMQEIACLAQTQEAGCSVLTLWQVRWVLPAGGTLGLREQP